IFILNKIQTLIMGLKKFNRYIIYFISLFIISLGASLSIKANLGTSPLICLPYVCSLITKYSVGEVMFAFTLIFILMQVVLLGRGFEKRQYLQFVVGTIFSFFIDFSLMLVDFINPVGYASQMILLLVSCVVVAFGVLLEIQTEIVYLPADGVIVAISKVIKKEFSNVKPFVDTSLVVIAAILSVVFLGYLAGVREGTVISAIIIGPIVKILKKYLDSYVECLIG
ncbi:YczE/YyaS/YitT family protein, partial [Methanobrevibacter sp.]|uniref:YczE/YyaS/YitT family protein n=1 Tax=Methanobrevibacter sp. TaxID=66852 RepID=UPI00388D4139